MATTTTATVAAAVGILVHNCHEERRRDEEEEARRVIIVSHNKQRGSGNILATSSDDNNGDGTPISSSTAKARRHKTHVDMAWRRAEAERMRRWNKEYDVEVGGDVNNNYIPEAKPAAASANYEVDQTSLLLPPPSSSSSLTVVASASPAPRGGGGGGGATIIDSYPTFTIHHKSLLKKYLTPHVWSSLSNKSTVYGTTIEDIIKPGVALPLGADPPRRIGVLVGDAECYTTFRELLDPIIRDYHGIGRGNIGGGGGSSNNNNSSSSGSSNSGSSNGNSSSAAAAVEDDDSDFDEWIDPELPNESNFIRKKIEGVVAGGPILQTSGDHGAKRTQKNSGSDVLLKSGGIADDDQEYYTTDENDVEATTTTTATTTATTASTTQQQQQQQTMLKLRRHPTIINNPRLLITNRQADPMNKYIISTRIRVARSLVGYRFPSTMTRCERRQVEQLVGECVSNLQLGNGGGGGGGTYRSVLSMTSEQNQRLISNHVLFDNPNEWTIACGLGRDWPDGRSVYANVPNLFATDSSNSNNNIDNDSNNNATTTTTTTNPDFMIWVNEEDHLRIMCLRSGGDIQGVFATLTNGVRLLERELRLRNVQFVHDYRLGYLTSCPTNVGTAMRASVHVKLVMLGKVPGFFQLVERLKLEVRGKYGETDRMYTGIFDISNLERLGKSEVHLINVMVEGVAKLIDIERRLEAGEEVNIDAIA